jgi:hypothetical protein
MLARGRPCHLSVGPTDLARSGRDQRRPRDLRGCAMIYRFGDCLLDTQRHQLQRASQPRRLRSRSRPDSDRLLSLMTARARVVGLKRERCRPASFYRRGSGSW